jgi:hypothetical protein
MEQRTKCLVREVLRHLRYSVKVILILRFAMIDFILAKWILNPEKAEWLREN